MWRGYEQAHKECVNHINKSWQGKLPDTSYLIPSETREPEDTYDLEADLWADVCRASVNI